MDPTPEALAAHSFEYDPSALDKPLAEFLQRFYTFSDDKENANSWAECFAGDGVMKKAATNVQGRDIFRQNDINKQLLYGPELGSTSLRESIGKWLNDFYAPSAGSIPSERIVITNGASNGLATILQKFTDPSTRAVWMVEPTYFLACPIFRDAGLMARIRGAPEGEDGVDLDFLAKALQEVDDEWPADASLPPRKLAKAGYPKIYKHFIYLIPTFSNPSGKTMGIENRRKLVQLARKHDALIVTDDVYDMLRCVNPESWMLIEIWKVLLYLEIL
ncbi:hypothetical protein K4K54_002206 [Colletotrichum sp. SAR 10_86]|nr:hypothetical protein K4K54_002206 [Colletotrichum sp. SAR 10_86]